MSLVEERKKDEAHDTLLLVEHEPVITLGIGAPETGVVASRRSLKELGIEVIRVERGGKTTYHGPGQVVGYPILHLDQLRMGVKAYVSKLEDTMILAAERIGVTARRLEGYVGVFCDKGKIGAIGVRVTKGVCFHGFAFNVAPNLNHYKLIVPCGMAEIPVTSVADVLGSEPSLVEVRKVLLESFLEVFDFRVRPEFEARPDRS